MLNRKKPNTNLFVFTFKKVKSILMAALSLKDEPEVALIRTCQVSFYRRYAPTCKSKNTGSQSINIYINDYNRHIIVLNGQFWHIKC